MILYEITELVAEYNLPPLPDPADESDAEARILVLFRQDAINIVLTLPVPFTDAVEYTNREDTHGDKWFVGRDLPNDYLPGELY